MEVFYQSTLMPEFSIKFLIFAWLVFQCSHAMAVTVSVRVGASNDDAEERISDGDMYRDSTDLETSYDDYHGGLQIVGMRFRNVAIPQGATISSAYIEFETDETDSGTTSLQIYGEDSDTTNEFASNGGDISSRTSTSATVNWNPSAWNSVNQIHQTPDIGTIIKEIVDRPGWSSGNNLIIMIGPGAGCTNSNCERTAESWDGDSSAAPLLVVDYSIGGLICETYRDNFNSTSYGNHDGSMNWSGNWVETNDNGSANSGDIQISGNRLEIKDDDRSIARSADLSSYDSATLTFDYEENGFDNTSDYVDVEVRQGGGSWINLQRFSGSSVNSGSASLVINSADLAADTEVRLITSNSLGNNDRFRVDNFEIEACQSAATPVPVIEWRQDELSWSGATDEVVDSSGNNNHAMSNFGSGLDTIAAGQVCRAGSFDGVDDYIESNDVFALLQTTATLSFWIRTTQVGNDTGWLAPGIAGVEQSAGTDDIFWGWIDASGRIGVSVGDDYSSKSTLAINNGVYHHVVLSRDATTGDFKIYIDGALDSSGTIASGVIGTGFSSIGRIEDTGGSPEYLQGDLDEVLIFDSILSDADVSSIYTNQLAGNNFDGSVRTCPIALTPLLEYRFEEGTWNGTPDEIIDHSGNGHHAQLNNNSTPASASPAITGDPGTCGYAFQNDGSIQVTGLPLDTTTTGIKTTVTFWMNWDGTNSNVMPIGWNFHDIWIVSGAIGFNSWNNDVYGISSTGLANAWHHISAEFTNGNITANRLYVDGVEQTLSQIYGSPNNSTAYVNSELRVGGVSNSGSYDFHGSLDEVRVYEGALTTAQVNTIMAETHPCSTSLVDHYAITHSGQGITCEAEPITITAHDASDAAVAPSSSTTITLSTSIASDGWSLQTGNGTFTLPNQYTFDGTETSAVFMLSKIASVTGMDIDVTDGSATDNDGDALEDDPIDYVESLLQFVTNTNTPPGLIINSQIGGKPSSSAPNAQDLYLRAVRSDNTTGNPVCVAALDTGTHNIEMGYQCIDTNNCSSNELGVNNSLTYNSGTATTVAHNDGATTASTVAVILDFDTGGYAALSFQYDNVGEIVIFADDYTAANGGVIVGGVSDQFIVRPFALTLDFDNGSGNYNMRELDWSDGNLDGSGSNNSYSDPTSNPQNSSVFQIAGTDFPAEINGVLWQASDDSNNDGEPDSGANLFNNSLSNLFGQESSRSIQVTHNLEQPTGVGVNLGTLTSNFPNPYINGRSEGTMNWDEVGIIDVQLTLNTYLGDTTYTPISVAEDVGRFRPAAFDVINVASGELDNVCKGAILTTDHFTYIGQDFSYDTNPSFTVRALNALATPQVTQNYRGAFMKLDATSITLSDIVQDLSTSGSDSNPLLVSFTRDTLAFTSNNNGTVDYVFGDDDFRYGEDNNALDHIKYANSEVMPFTAGLETEITLISDGEFLTDLSAAPVNFDIIGNELRFARIRMSNVHGSELIDLQMPMIVEYFNGSTYQINLADDFDGTVGCTAYNANDFIVTDNLLTPGASTISMINPIAVFGNLGVNLSSAGEDNIGQIDITGQLSGGIVENKWLRYDWDADGVFNNNPEATATFGIYKGNDVNIYIQQIFQ